ncbi:helix-turn-helix domain-containing protein [Streptomyces sp. NPDC057010]|uniref:AraC-like ligand-binding domain-containing protein n=1 Tax=Streptomyces sp. NPDC057010 TaxID=3345997 RepID=UPI003636EEB1
MGVWVGSSVVSAAAVPCGDRFEWFYEALTSDLMPLALSPRHTADFRAKITDLDLGAVRLTAFAYSPVLARRTSAHVRRGDPEQFQLALITRGAIRTSQRGTESIATGDSLVLTDTSRAMESQSVGAAGLAEALVLQIPRSHLLLSPDRADRLLAREIRAGEGSAAILAGFLRTLLAHGPSCQPEELLGMGSVALDLATACLARQLGTPELAPAEARAQEMLQRISRFIENNLGDPELTPQVIADRHCISLSSLYVLFRDQPMSVAARIRQGRLQRAHADLARPDLRGQPVQTIAARWGFRTATAFSRAFREAYGTTPTEHRQSVLGAPQ